MRGFTVYVAIWLRRFPFYLQPCIGDDLSVCDVVAGPQARWRRWSCVRWPSVPWPFFWPPMPSVLALEGFHQAHQNSPLWVTSIKWAVTDVSMSYCQSGVIAMVTCSVYGLAHTSVCSWAAWTPYERPSSTRRSISAIDPTGSLWSRWSPKTEVSHYGMGLLPYIRKIAGCACAGIAGNVFPATDFKGNH